MLMVSFRRLVSGMYPRTDSRRRGLLITSLRSLHEIHPYVHGPRHVDSRCAGVGAINRGSDTGNAVSLNRSGF